jgi:gliding motility-associated protein GldM
MAGGKETPRQKMIGMMYLVLTALLAMNISKDVLNAFIQINKGLTKTNSILEEKSRRTIDGINASTEGAKAIPFQQKVAEVDKWATELMTYIEEMKGRVMASSDKGNETGEGFEEFMKEEGGKKIAIMPDEKNADGKLIITKPDENQNNTSLLIGHEPATPRADPFSAVDFKNHLLKFRDDLLAIQIQRADSGAATFTLPEDMQEAIKNTFTFDGPYFDSEGKEESWEVNNFYHMPLVAVLANITKYQTDVMNVKNNVCMALAQGINATDMKFSDITVAVVPKQSYIIRGGEFEAEVYLAAYNRSSKSKIYMAGEASRDAMATVFDVAGRSPEAESDNEGKCHFKVSTGGLSVGEHAYKGQIEYMKNGKPEYIPFIVPPFFVGEPVAVVNASKCNVMYKGVENPIEVSVPGANGKIVATCQGCAAFNPSGNGTYMASPDPAPSAKEAIITVSAEVNGEMKNMGSKPFRLKRLPDPNPEFATRKASDTEIKRTAAMANDKIFAKLDSDFLFEGISYSVKSFKFYVFSGGNVKEWSGNGNTLSSEMKAAISAAKNNSQIGFTSIIAVGPDGADRKLNNIILKLVD